MRRLPLPLPEWSFDYVTDTPLIDCPQRLIDLRMAFSKLYIEVEPITDSETYSFRVEYFIGTSSFNSRGILWAGAVGELRPDVIGTRVTGHADVTRELKWIYTGVFVLLAFSPIVLFFLIGFPVFYFYTFRKQKQAMVALHHALPPVAKR